MTNERYLQISYFVVLACSLGLGLLVYGFLRVPFRRVCEKSGSRLAPVVSKFFLVGIVGPAMLGFCSVSYFSCNKTTYPAILEDLGYLVEVNQSQLQWAMLDVIVALIIWCLIVFALLLTPGHSR